MSDADRLRFHVGIDPGYSPSEVAIVVTEQLADGVTSVIGELAGPAACAVAARIATLEARIEELEVRIVTDADEAFGPFPVQTAEEALTAIERGVFEMRQERERLVMSRDAGYRERNQLVSALARLLMRTYDARPECPAVAWLAQHDPNDVSWDPEWRTIVFIDGPTGQLSWHLHDSDVPLFAGLPRGPNSWDGHTTPEKYERLARLGAAPTASSEVGKQEQ